MGNEIPGIKFATLPMEIEIELNDDDSMKTISKVHQE